MPRLLKLRQAWEAVSHFDTVLSVVKWGGSIWFAVKIAVGLLSGGVTLLIGLIEGYRWPVVLLTAFLVAVIAVWLVNGLMYVANQWTFRQMMDSGTFGGTGLAAPLKPRASQADLAQSVIVGKTVRLADLVPDAPNRFPYISHKTFEDCDLMGPALVFGVGPTTWESSTFEADFDSCVYPIERDRGLIGVIGMEYCAIRNCRVHRSGLVVPAGEIDELRKGFLDDPK